MNTNLLFMGGGIVLLILATTNFVPSLSKKENLSENQKLYGLGGVGAGLLLFGVYKMVSKR